MIEAGALLMLFVGLGLGALAAALVALYLGNRRVARQVRELEERELQRLHQLKGEVNTFQQGSIRMGEELMALREQFKRMEDKQLRIEQHDPQSLPYNQAARLVSLGASVEDLTQSCGLSKAEAELVAKLHAARKP